MPFLQLLVNVLPIGAGMTVKYLFFKKRGFGADYLAGVKEGLATAGKCKKVGYRPEHLKNYLAIEWELFTGTLLIIFYHGKSPDIQSHPAEPFLQALCRVLLL